MPVARGCVRTPLSTEKVNFQNYSPCRSHVFAIQMAKTQLDFTQSYNYVVNWVNFQSSVILVHNTSFHSLGGVLSKLESDLSLMNNAKTVGQHVRGSCRLIFSA